MTHKRKRKPYETLGDISKGSPGVAIKKGCCVRHEDRAAVVYDGGIPLCEECASDVKGAGPGNSYDWSQYSGRGLSSLHGCLNEVGGPRGMTKKHKKGENR